MPDLARLHRIQARASRWANGVLYAELAKLTPTQWTRVTSANFGSIQGIANHALLADRLWLHRLTGQGTPLDSVSQVAHADFPALWAARQAQDEDCVAFVEGLTPERLREDLSFRTIEGTPRVLPVGLCVAHLLNHQTHHRGQMHGMLGEFGLTAPDIDLVYYPDALRD